MWRVRIIIHFLCAVFIFNGTTANAQDSSSVEQGHIKIYNDLHYGILRTQFLDPAWGNFIETEHFPNYNIRFVLEDISLSFNIGFHSSDFTFNHFFRSGSNRIIWNTELGIKEKYFFKINRISQYDLSYFNGTLAYNIGYISERTFSITDFLFRYAPNFLNKKDMIFKIGGGLSNCNGHDEYLEAGGWTQGGWFEAFFGTHSINELGYIFEAEYYYRPFKHVSFRAFTNYRHFKTFVPLFSYGISGGVSF